MSNSLNSIIARVSLRQLRYFVAVAEAGSISAAAHLLHLSQPPLSVQIQELESTLAVRLLTRHRNGVTLTEPGKVMLAEARSILERSARAIGRVQQTGRGEFGEVRIGILSSIMWTRFADCLNTFQTRYPQVQWNLEELNPDQQITALNDHRIDAGVWRSDRAAPDNLQSHLLWEERIQAALPANHPLAKTRAVSLKELTKLPYLSMDMRWSKSSTDILTAIQRLGLEPVVAHTAREPQTLMALIASGSSFALMPESLQRIPWPGVVFRPVLETLPHVDIYMHVRKSDQSPTTERFVETILEALRKYPELKPINRSRRMATSKQGPS